MAANVSPMPGHAHDDYRNRPPLLAALDAGCVSVEADVWLLGGELRVGHDREHAERGGTLAEVYLEPLLERLRRGALIRGHPEAGVRLVVDVKTDATETYLALEDLLGRHPAAADAAQVTLSGHRDLALMTERPRRRAAYDGRVVDLDRHRDLSVSLMPMVSDDWRKHFGWRGLGPLPSQERDRLAHLVGTTHEQGRILRFWGTPQVPLIRERVWGTLLGAGVDLINVDDLGAARRFFDRAARSESSP